jgi:hypothetical protein
MVARSLDAYPSVAHAALPPATTKMTTITTTNELERLRELHSVVEALLMQPPEWLGAVRAEVSRWSPLHHVAHLTLANELVLRNLRSLAKGSGLFVTHEAETSPVALAVLQGGEIPRGRAQAPRMVAPPKNPELPSVQEWSAGVRTELDALARGWDTVIAPSGARGYVPHQLLGPLDAAHWARFGAVHTRHHLVIVHEIWTASGAPAVSELDALATSGRS